MGIDFKEPKKPDDLAPAIKRLLMMMWKDEYTKAWEYPLIPAVSTKYDSIASVMLAERPFSHQQRPLLVN